VNLSEREAKDFQAAIFIRYKVRLWHVWMQRHLDGQAYPARLAASNGFTRRFFGRPREILGEALAHLPQVFTTYTILKGLHNLWNDSENRHVEDGKCKLRVEPLHTVHDENVVQFRQKDLAWAKIKLKEWFTVPVVIA